MPRGSVVREAPTCERGCLAALAVHAVATESGPRAEGALLASYTRALCRMSSGASNGIRRRCTARDEIPSESYVISGRFGVL